MGTVVRLPSARMPPKFDPDTVHTLFLRVVGGEVPGGAVLAPKCGPLGLAPKKLGDDISKGTKEWKGLKEPVRDRKKVKDIEHDGDISLDDVYEISRTMRYKSMARQFSGTVKEILGTANSLGCTVDGESPMEWQEQIDSGELVTPEE